MVDDKDKTEARFAEPAALGTFEWIRSRMWDQNVLIQRGQYDREDSYTLLSQGRLAMIEEGTSFMYWLAENVKRRWDIMHLPQGRQVAGGAPSPPTPTPSTGGWSTGAQGRRLDVDALPGQPGVPADDAAGQVAGHRAGAQVGAAGVRQDDAPPGWPAGQRAPGELIQEAIHMGYHHAVEPESFRTRAGEGGALDPGAAADLREGRPGALPWETARLVEQTQVKRGEATPLADSGRGNDGPGTSGAMTSQEAGLRQALRGGASATTPTTTWWSRGTATIRR